MALKNEQKIYAAAGLLVLLLGGFWAVQKSASEDATAHTQAGLAANLPDIKLSAEDVDKVTKIEIKNAAKPEIVVEKDGDLWKVTKPIASPANQSNAKSLLDNLKELKVKDSIDVGSAQYATYEVDDDKAVHVKIWKGADKALDLYFGKSGTRGQMTRVAGKDGVYVASGYSSYVYTREVKDWRDRELLKFEEANAISAAVSNDNGVFSFSKNDDKWSGTFKGNPIKNFDPEKVKDMVRAYRTLSVEDFADDKSPAETGLDHPATISFTLKDNAGTPKVFVGKTSTGSARYAMKEGSPTVFTLSSWAAEWATAAPSKFQKAEASKDGGVESASMKSDAKKKMMPPGHP